MLTVILHNNDVLRLVSFQKTMINFLNCEHCTFVQNYPLWIDAAPLSPLLEKKDEDFQNLTKDELKSISKKIKKIQILKPEFLKDESLVSPVVFYTADEKKYSSSLVLLKKLSGKIQGKKNPPEKDLEQFPMDIKTFRLGTKTEQAFYKGGKLLGIKDSVWVTAR